MGKKIQFAVFFTCILFIASGYGINFSGEYQAVQTTMINFFVLI